MNVNDFVEQLTRATYPKLTKVQVRRLLDAFVRIVRDLPEGEELILKGFGAFRKIQVAPRTVYTRGLVSSDVSTKAQETKSYEVPAMEVLKFRAFRAAKKPVTP